MTQKILVVDDEGDLLELVKYNLLKDGLEIKCVTSGEDAISSWSWSKPHLQLTLERTISIMQQTLERKSPRKITGSEKTGDCHLYFP